jgi:hypothetical protein
MNAADGVKYVHQFGAGEVAMFQIKYEEMQVRLTLFSSINFRTY